MYERFTDRARKVMILANEESQRLNHQYIGTEHLVLELIKERSGVAANVLKNLDVDLERIRLKVEKLVRSHPDIVMMSNVPRTLQTKKVIEYSMDEARKLNHDYIGTEHILLGLLRYEDAIAAHALMSLGVTLQETRDELLNLLGYGLERGEDSMHSVSVWRRLGRLFGAGFERAIASILALSFRVTDHMNDENKRDSESESPTTPLRAYVFVAVLLLLSLATIIGLLIN